MGSGFVHQKALTKKTLYLNRQRYILTILQVLVPALLVAILGLAQIYFVPYEDIPAYDFNAERWDMCPIGFYGTYLERILPEDFFSSGAAYGTAGIAQEFYPPSIEKYPELENYPDGFDEMLCNPMHYARNMKTNRKSIDSQNLQDLIYYLDSGSEPSVTRLTYSVPGQAKAGAKPGFVTWLEGITTDRRPQIQWDKLPGPTASVCSDQGCQASDVEDYLFEQFFAYRCPSTVSTTHDYSQAECNEVNFVKGSAATDAYSTVRPLDGPGVSLPELTYRDAATIGVPNQYLSEISHIVVKEDSSGIDVKIQPNQGTGYSGSKLTLPLLSNPIVNYGMIGMYDPIQVQGMYGSSHKGWLMDLAPVVSLYAMTEGSKAIEPADITAKPLAEYLNIINTAHWWAVSAHKSHNKAQKSSTRTGVPDLPWFYRGGLPTETEHKPEKLGDLYKEYNPEVRAVFSQFGQVWFSSICHVKNAGVNLPNLPVSNVQAKIALNAAYEGYKLMMREAVVAAGKLYNKPSYTTKPLGPVDADRFIANLDSVILSSVSGDFNSGISSNEDRLVCRGEDLEKISKAFSEMWFEHFDSSLFENVTPIRGTKCDCTNIFCGRGLICSFFLSTVWNPHKIFMDQFLDQMVYSHLNNLAVLETKEAAFPQPKGAVSIFGSFFSAQSITYQALIFSFMCPVIFFLKSLMADKEGGVVSYLNVFGVTQMEYWGNYLGYGVIYNIFFSLVVGILVECFVLKWPNYFVVCFAFFCQGMLLVCLCVFLSACFKTGNNAVLCAVVLMITMHSCFMWVNMMTRDRLAWLKYLCCGLPGFQIDFSMRNLLLAETWTQCDGEPQPAGTRPVLDGSCKVKGAGIEWMTRDIDGVNVLGLGLSALAFGAFWCFLGFWTMNVIPNDGRPKKPWNFMCSKRYWDAKRGKRRDEDNEGATDADAPQADERVTEWFEDAPEGDYVLNIDHVSKRFKNGKKVRKERGDYFWANRDVSLKVRRGEIFGLLGHNGAGKTTLMNMMTGKLAPTHGTITIDGWDVAKDPSQAKATVGFCPQFDILFPYMTVREHFEFVGKIKMVENLEEEVMYAAEVLSMVPKLDFYVNQLSGGQRRRVSCGMAVIGRPSLVILDEPSTGIDPATRRSLWKCIKNIAKAYNCGIILTTHFMDEADYLSDRIAIMAAGQVMAMGRSNFLKRACDSGYALFISKSTSDVAVAEKLDLKVKSVVPGAAKRSDVANEVVYRIPFNAIEELSHMVEVFEEPSALGDYGVKAFSVGVSSIEDVFLRVGAHAEAQMGELAPLQYDVFGEYAKFQGPRGIKGRFSNDWMPLIWKKWLFILRSPLMVIICILGPMLNFLLFGAMITSQFSYGQGTVLDLNAELYTQHTTVPDNPKVFATGPAPFVDCLKDLGYDVVEDTSYKTMVADQRTSFDEAGGSPALWGVDLSGADGSGQNGSQPMTLFHNSGFYSWALPISYVEVTKCWIKSRGKDYDVSLSYGPQVRITSGGDSVMDSIAKGALNMIFVFSLLYASGNWIAQTITDRTTRSMHLQFVAGAKPWCYWLTNYIMDILVFLPSLIFLSLMAWGWGAPLFERSDSASCFLLGCFLYSLADIPRSYFFSRFFNSTAGGIGVNMAYFGVITIVATIMPLISTLPGAQAAIYVLEFFPTFLLQIHGGQISSVVDSCPFTQEEQPVLWEALCYSVWDMGIFLYKADDDADRQAAKLDAAKASHDHGFGYYLTRYLTNWLLWCLVLAFVDFRDRHPQKFNAKGKKERKIDNPEVLPEEDASVKAERERVLAKYNDVGNDEVFEQYNKDMKNDPEAVVARRAAGQEDVELLVLRRLRKAFCGKNGTCCGLCAKCCKKKKCGASPNKVAVDDLTFAVNRGECFGFLGMNGAGKTTTVSMLIGELATTGGAAHFDGANVHSKRSDFYQNIGFCPQFDGLIPIFTGREILRFYALLSNMEKSKVKDFADEVVNLIGIEEYADRLIKTYSGGNKRKLSLALAFVGNPKVVFLDEPSSGVDPASQRRLWSVITETTKFSDRCVLLTTHAMDECEALCDKLCIMKEGVMLCLGSSNELRANYGKGYMVEAYIDGDVQDCLDRIDKHFNGIVIQEIISNRVRFGVAKDKTKLSGLLRFLSRNADEYGLRDYGVSDISLEAIFVELNADFLDDASIIENNFEKNMDEELMMRSASIAEECEEAVLPESSPLSHAMDKEDSHVMEKEEYEYYTDN